MTSELRPETYFTQIFECSRECLVSICTVLAFSYKLLAMQDQTFFHCKIQALFKSSGLHSHTTVKCVFGLTAGIVQGILALLTDIIRNKCGLKVYACEIKVTLAGHVMCVHTVCAWV